MKGRRRWWAIGLVAAVALVAAGCEGATDSKSAAPNTAGEASGRQAIAATSAAGRTGAAPAATVAAGTDKAAVPAQGAQAPAQGGQQAGVPGAADGRMIIYNVSLDLVLKDVQTGYDRIGQIAAANGGLIADSNMRIENDVRKASITIRVPTDRYLNVLSEIRGLGKVETEKSSANDVTEEFTDLQSRQRALEATEAQLMELLKRANNVGEVLTVQDKLNAVRTDIEKVRGRQNLLGKLSEMATIAMQLKPEPPVVSKFRGGSGGLWAAVTEPEDGPVGALRNGWDASTQVLGAIGIVLLTAVAFGWWLVPFLVVFYWFLRRELRRRSGGPVATGTLPPPAAAGEAP